jgi:hypothetical protein
MPVAHDVPIVRSVVAVLAGFFAVMMLGAVADMMLERAAPPNALVIKLAYETGFALIAGYIAARVGVRKPLQHALIMATLVLAGRAIIAALTWKDAPPWFHIAVLVLIVPAALLGAKLCELRARSLQA